MKPQLIGVVHTLNMHIMAGQGAIDGAIRTERQPFKVHGRLFPDTVTETDAVALPAQGIGIFLQLSLGRRKYEPALKFFY